MSIHDPLRVCALDEPHSFKDVEALLKLSPDYVHPELRQALRDVIPPSNNMGGQEPYPPLFFPQCEKQDVSVVKNLTKIDWLGFTSLNSIEAVRMAVQVFFPTCDFVYTGKGMYGYPKSDFIMVDGEQYGILGYGASHGRNFVSLPGTGCSTWDADQIEIVYETLQVLEARIGRVDICLDFFNGERTWDHALFCYERGDFNRGRHGNKKPYMKKFDQSQDGMNLGRTLYVNRRGSEVMARIYEKGYEVFANMPSAYKTLSQAREVEYVDNGGSVPFADSWLRVEIEFKRVEDDRPIPLEILLERDNYFAGAFPYCAEVVKHATPTRPKDLRTEKEVDLIKLLASARTAYGSLVHTLATLGYSNADIVEVLSNGKENKRLRESGVTSMLQKVVAEWKKNNPDHEIPF